MSLGESCSQARITVQPASRSAESWRRSRATLASNLASHHVTLRRGGRKWSGHLCQKHPSTNTATLRVLNTMSGEHRRPCTGATCFRKRSPRRCSSERTIRSTSLSAVLPRITADTAGDDGAGERLFAGIKQTLAGEPERRQAGVLKAPARRWVDTIVERRGMDVPGALLNPRERVGEDSLELCRSLAADVDCLTGLSRDSAGLRTVRL